jgi:hypothetical protein
MQNMPPKITQDKGRRLRAAAIILISCVCGWFMMELEILGVRVLVPYFGSAVYVITGSVIGVFLLSLSFGYILGGWLSGKINAWIELGAVMVAAGGCFVAIPFFDEPVCMMIFNAGFDERWGSLAASLILFGVPTVLLGTVSPTVMHWLTTQASKSGFNAGLVLATSTISSFAGCIMAAFYLVLYSLRLTLCISGVIMMVLGGIILLAAGRKKKNQTENRNEQVL